MTVDTPPPKGPVERLLAPIADVRAGEDLLKTAREVFILSEGGAEVKSYAAAGQTVVLLVLVPTYGTFASHVNRRDVLQAGVVFAGERAAFAVPAFAAVNLALTGGWFVVVAALNRQLRARAAAGRERL